MIYSKLWFTSLTMTAAWVQLILHSHCTPIKVNIQGILPSFKIKNHNALKWIAWLHRYYLKIQMFTIPLFFSFQNLTYFINNLFSFKNAFLFSVNWLKMNALLKKKNGLTSLQVYLILINVWNLKKRNKTILLNMYKYLNIENFHQ